MDKSNDLKQVREQIRKLDERLDCDMQVRQTLPHDFKNGFIPWETTKRKAWKNRFTSCFPLHVCISTGAGPGGAGVGRRDGVDGKPLHTSQEESELRL